MYFVKVSMYDRWGAGGLGWALTTVRGHTALNFLLLDIASERKEWKHRSNHLTLVPKALSNRWSRLNNFGRGLCPKSSAPRSVCCRGGIQYLIRGRMAEWLKVNESVRASLVQGHVLVGFRLLATLKLKCYSSYSSDGIHMNAELSTPRVLIIWFFCCHPPPPSPPQPPPPLPALFFFKMASTCCKVKHPDSN